MKCRLIMLKIVSCKLFVLYFLMTVVPPCWLYVMNWIYYTKDLCEYKCFLFLCNTWSCAQPPTGGVDCWVEDYANISLIQEASFKLACEKTPVHSMLHRNKTVTRYAIHG